jgi:LCP family protein required for cell wall assembly
VLITANIIAALGLIVVGSAYGYARWRLAEIKTVAAPHLSKNTLAAGEHSTDGLLPENILLIGNETRSGLTNQQEIAQFGSPQQYSGSLSDVIMILHLDPATRAASILSIPRDLFLPMPAGSPVGPFQKVDAALNDGVNGPDNLIQAITADLGIPINHYIELNFDGFQQTVNALGGINMDFPEPLFDGSSLLDVGAGCIHLNGAQALALVRARHLQYDPPGVSPTDKAAWPYDPESDLSRIVRDHTFLRVLAATAEHKGLTNLFEINSLVGAVINQITIDPGLKSQLITLVSHYRSVNPADAPETTLPITTVGSYYYQGSNIGDVDFPVQPADNQVIAAWDSHALPTPVTPTGVQVDNISGNSTATANAATALAADGLHVLGTSTLAQPATTTESWVRYPPGQAGTAQALAVMSHLAGAAMLEPDPTVPAGQINLDVGSLVTVTTPPKPAATTTTASTVAPAATTTTTTTTVPTPGGEKPSASADVQQPWDPQPCA